MNKVETKYLLWFYSKQPKSKILNWYGEFLNSKLMKEQETEHLLSLKNDTQNK